jgi:penicillin-binding protein 1A
MTGTGSAAQIGRPVAGKTGTTSSNKDGWFIGFSSGLTTGVWMGRDDARTVGGLQGGTAPARAFRDFMRVAVANRPVEPFETQVPIPDWQLTPEEQMFGDAAMDGAPLESMVDENGMPLGPAADPYGLPQAPADQPFIRPGGPGEPTQQELDQAFPPQGPQRPPPPQGQPQDPRLPAPADPSDPRAQTP